MQYMLLLHSADDRAIPVWQARALAERLPAVRYVEVEGFDHPDLPSMRDPALHDRLLRFLDEHVPADP